MGLIAGAVYLATMFVFIPVPFVNFFRESFFETEKEGIPLFPHDSVSKLDYILFESSQVEWAKLF
jgi:hypothetical protein